MSMFDRPSGGLYNISLLNPRRKLSHPSQAVSLKIHNINSRTHGRAAIRAQKPQKVRKESSGRLGLSGPWGKKSSKRATKQSNRSFSLRKIPAPIKTKLELPPPRPKNPKPPKTRKFMQPPFTVPAHFCACPAKVSELLWKSSSSKYFVFHLGSICPSKFDPLSATRYAALGREAEALASGQNLNTYRGIKYVYGIHFHKIKMICICSCCSC